MTDFIEECVAFPNGTHDAADSGDQPDLKLLSMHGFRLRQQVHCAFAMPLQNDIKRAYEEIARL